MCETSNASVEETAEPPKSDLETECADVVIVGGGLAGLSAALVLARVQRSVLIFDKGDKRNETSRIQHAVLGADGCERHEFIDRAREQVSRYPTVRFYWSKVVDLRIKAAKTRSPADDEDTQLRNGKIVEKTWGFEAVTEEGSVYRSKKVILATGVQDEVPGVDGFLEYYGRGVWVCLYCDGFEYRNKRLAAYGNGNRGVHIAFEMLSLSQHVMLLTDGEPLEATQFERQLMKEKGIPVIETPLKRAYGAGNHLTGVELIDGTKIDIDALFFNTGRRQTSNLPDKLGLRQDKRGDVIVCQARGNVECVHGLYVAGNCAIAPLKLVLTAASQGAVTGAKVNTELMYQELALHSDGRKHEE